MPTTRQTLQETERYNSEQREKRRHKTAVSGKSRMEKAEGRCAPLLPKTVYSWALESEKSSYAGSLSLMGERVYVCVVGFGENEEAYGEYLNFCPMEVGGWNH